MATTPKCKKRILENDSASPSPKRARKDLSLEEKINLIEDSDKIPKLTQKQLGEKYGIGCATVSDILKKKEFYNKQYADNSTGNKKRFTISSKYGDLNDLLFKWFTQARAKNIPLSGPILQEKALHFAKELDLTDFKASNGWLDSWKSRFSIAHFKVCGESGDVNLETVNNFLSRIDTNVQDYQPEDIFNCYETGLFFRALPDKTLAQKKSACKGGKIAKERLTVMFCCSAMGEKLKPMVIGKARKPRCFKNIDVTNLSVIWRSNKKSWMTEATFLDWIKSVNRIMRLKKRNIILFLDNATSHSHEIQLSNVKLSFLPPNTTSKLQPLDLGIIRAFKARYRKKNVKPSYIKH
ncbi:unnamed protein product [Mytilus coruscus]|uniref:HTH CENPB-type domain-containing protein n=1 Tax=Mytilus coruscus TaxID=42192 RepID=A0A6J8BNE4_MYTCO|nr:unnamed protein product [Mytilus coruscus]